MASPTTRARDANHLAEPCATTCQTLSDLSCRSDHQLRSPVQMSCEPKPSTFHSQNGLTHARLTKDQAEFGAGAASVSAFHRRRDTDHPCATASPLMPKTGFPTSIAYQVHAKGVSGPAIRACLLVTCPFAPDSVAASFPNGRKEFGATELSRIGVKDGSRERPHGPRNLSVDPD